MDDEHYEDVEVGSMLPWDGPIDIPDSRKGMYKTFGNPGGSQVNRKWEMANMVVARNLPGAVKKRYVHRLMEPYLREALRRAEELGVLDEIRKMGSFAFRHQRHDPSRPLSDHAFGIALDINPKENGARRYPKGDAPAPFSDEWRKVWPAGVSRELVLAFESTGFEWGGRWRRFPDPMHFSLRKRR